MKTIAIILSAGQGTRLRPLTNNIPKCLLEVHGESILSHEIRALEGLVDEIYVVVGYKADQIISKFVQKVKFFVNRDYDKTNNSYSLYLALEELKFNFDRLVLLNGDILFDRSILEDMLRKEENLIAVDTTLYRGESMKVTLDGNRINKISKDIKREDAYGVSIDLYSFSKDVSEKLYNVLKKLDKNVWTEVAIQEILSKANVYPFDIGKRFWCEIDTLEDLKEANRRVLLEEQKRNILSKELFLFDLDGTLILGKKALPYAKSFINKLMNDGKKVVILTNNTSKTKKQHLSEIKSILGVKKLKKENIYTATEDTVKWLKDNGINRIFLLSTRAVYKEFSDFGFSISGAVPNSVFDGNKLEFSPQAVVVAFDKSLTYKKLSVATSILRKNKSVKLVFTNGDLLCPTESGFIPDTGSIGEFIKVATERKPDFVGGKPNKSVIEAICERFNVPKESCVLFGDRLYTDYKMGENSGIMTVLVLTGETQMEDLDLDFLRNNVVLKNFGELGVEDCPSRSKT
jgi:HAD superfamily hydrolase (TIGR01450 family)